MGVPNYLISVRPESPKGIFKSGNKKKRKKYKKLKKRNDKISKILEITKLKLQLYKSYLND